LVTNPDLNWRDSTLQTDPEIVACLASTLGRPLGYGEKALGGYDPNGNSKLVVITKGGDVSVEDQILEAISGEDHAWIVFDKLDFAQETEVAMYRTYCSDSDVLATAGLSEGECLDYQTWCQSHGYAGDECLEQYFNVTLNDDALSIRNPVIGSNKTIDGRMANAFFRFSGFAIGSDSSGEPVITSSGVILTHLEFRGAGHTEDHTLDPDMIRSTGASHDIWIHKNTFTLTGDSAFDVKVGAYDITMSFNRVENVKRAALHGSSDSREINAQITTTMHHNAFVTTDDLYEEFGNTGRRVPLLRRGKSHMWNNLFMNYRKDIMSARVDAQLYWEDNALSINSAHMEKDSVEDSLAELQSQLARDFEGANYRADGVYLWFSDASCILDESTQTALSLQGGTVSDLMDDYSNQSQTTIAEVQLPAGQELIDYISATAGKHGLAPFNSPLAASISDVLGSERVGCQ
jgi:pectate lyase